jgi:hypothetical protein
MAVVDEVSPVSYGQDLIVLSVSQATPQLRAFEAILLDVDYAACLPAGIALPLELSITSESGAALYQRQVFRRFAPLSLAFVPREGGSHLVRLAEQHHNRWFGAILLDVEGSALKQGT